MSGLIIVTRGQLDAIEAEARRDERRKVRDARRFLNLMLDSISADRAEMARDVLNLLDGADPADARDDKEGL